MLLYQVPEGRLFAIPAYLGSVACRMEMVDNDLDSDSRLIFYIISLDSPIVVEQENKAWETEAFLLD